MSASPYVDPAAMPPPWQVFPDFGPDDLPATQGAEEAWFDQVWRPFWDGLTDTDREAYFDHWSATTAWRDAITFFFVTLRDLDDRATT